MNLYSRSIVLASLKDLVVLSCHVTLWAKHVRNAGSLNLQLELEFHLCGRASTGSHRKAPLPTSRVARSPSPGLRHTSEANLLAVAIELLDVVDGATPDEWLGKEHPLAIQPLLIILSWSFLDILFMLKSASPLQWNAMHQMQLNAVECNVWITNYSTSFCICFVCKVDSTQGALSLSDTDAMAHLPTDHRANNLMGLDFDNMDNGANIKFSMKTMTFSIYSEWIRAFAEVPLFKSPNVIKCLFDRSNHDSTCHILSHTKHDISYKIMHIYICHCKYTYTSAAMSLYARSSRCWSDLQARRGTV